MAQASLSRARLSEYDEALASRERAAAEFARASAEQAAEQAASVAEAREAAIEAVSEAVESYGDEASALACELYDELAEAAGASVPAAELDAEDVTEYVEKEVRYQARHLTAGDVLSFVSGVACCASDQVARKANRTVIGNASRDGARYARVPMGDACPFCLMLGSRGFVYHTKATAGGLTRFHADCRCKVVPGFQGVTEVEGYDPDALYDEYVRLHYEQGVSWGQSGGGRAAGADDRRRLYEQIAGRLRASASADELREARQWAEGLDWTVLRQSEVEALRGIERRLRGQLS